MIQSGETLNGTISAPSFSDSFVFLANEGDRVIVNAVTTSGELDTEITLLAPGGEETQWGDDSLNTVIAESGTYTIVVSDFMSEEPGTYEITFQKIPGALTSAADPDGGDIVSGQTLSGSIGSVSDMDAFEFTGQAGDRVIVKVVAKSETLEPNLDLYSPAGVSEVEGEEELNCLLQDTGTYTILLTDVFLGDTGGYDISLQINPGTITLGSSAKTIGYGSSYTFRGTLAANGTPLADRQVTLERSSDGKTYSDTSMVTLTSPSGEFSFKVKPTSTTRYRARYAGTPEGGAAVSPSVKVSVKAFVGKPSAPRTVRVRKKFTVSGHLKPRHTSGAYSVRVYGYNYYRGKWRSAGYIEFKASNHSTYSKYSRSISILDRGRWRLRAYHPSDSKNAASWSSGYEYVTVK